MSKIKSFLHDLGLETAHNEINQKQKDSIFVWFWGWSNWKIGNKKKNLTCNKVNCLNSINPRKDKIIDAVITPESDMLNNSAYANSL